jgi:hypothetical protein
VVKAIARFIMRGPSQAALVAAVTALLSVLMPPVALLSGASVGLVSLRGGPKDGLAVSAIATLGMGALAWLALGSPLPALGVLLMLWLPVVGLALVLRYSRSLGLTVQLAGAAAVLLTLLAYAFIEDPAAAWLDLLDPFRQALVQDGVLTEDASRGAFASLSRWMTGAFAAAVVAQVLLGLFVARWWQAILYNPGGFGSEFRTLRLSRSFGILTVLLLAALPFVGGVGLVANLLVALGVLLLLQGLAVAHQVHALKKAHAAWLIGLYVLMVIFMPQTLILLACIGLVDIWGDIRARVGQTGSGGNGPPG